MTGSSKIERWCMFIDIAYGLTSDQIRLSKAGLALRLDEWAEFMLTSYMYIYCMDVNIENIWTHLAYHADLCRAHRLASTRKVKPIWILLKQETVSGSGISWAICKSHLAPDR